MLNPGPQGQESPDVNQDSLHGSIFFFCHMESLGFQLLSATAIKVTRNPFLRLIVTDSQAPPKRTVLVQP